MDSDEDDEKERDLSVVDVSVDATVQRLRGVVLVQVVQHMKCASAVSNWGEDGLDEEGWVGGRCNHSP